MTMERRSPILAMLLVSASLLQTALAAEYVVGGSEGWNFAAENFYNDWAAQQSFIVGDTLKFNWTGSHDVVQVPPADAEACSESNAINKWTESGVSVPLTEAGLHGYLCSIVSHCPSGFMKMTVNVNAAESTSPPPPAAANSPPPPAGTTPTPPTPADAGSSLMQFCQPLLIAALALFAATAALCV